MVPCSLMVWRSRSQSRDEPSWAQVSSSLASTCSTSNAMMLTCSRRGGAQAEFDLLIKQCLQHAYADIAPYRVTWAGPSYFFGSACCMKVSKATVHPKDQWLALWKDSAVPCRNLVACPTKRCEHVSRLRWRKGGVEGTWPTDDKHFTATAVTAAGACHHHERSAWSVSPLTSCESSISRLNAQAICVFPPARQRSDPFR